MRLIVDFNIVFSIMKPDSVASAIFTRPDIELVAPEEMADEFGKWEKECMTKSKLPKGAFKDRVRFVSSHILLVNFEAYKKQLGEALGLISDEYDAPYIALGLATGLPVWSNDKELAKQDRVEVLDARELLTLIEE